MWKLNPYLFLVNACVPGDEVKSLTSREVVSCFMNTFYANVQVRVAAIAGAYWAVQDSVGVLNVKIDLAVFAALCE